MIDTKASQTTRRKVDSKLLDALADAVEEILPLAAEELPDLFIEGSFGQERHHDLRNAFRRVLENWEEK